MKSKPYFVLPLLLLSLHSVSQTHSEAADTAQKTNDVAGPYDKKYDLGIGNVNDSASGLSRSFALCESINNAIYKNNKGEMLRALLSDYPYASSYGITGTFYKDTLKLKVFKGGKKAKEIETKNDWKALLQQLNEYFVAEGFDNKRVIKVPFEGPPFKFKEHAIDKVLPGSIENQIPLSGISDSLKLFYHIRTYKSKDIDKEMREVYGSYTRYNENDLFFFRNDNVPYNLKAAIRPFVFPCSKWLSPTLTYLSGGQIYYENKNYGAALHSFYAALHTSNSLLASPKERAVVKVIAFSKISAIYSVQNDHTYLTLLYRLGEDLNRAYLNSEQSNDDRSLYYKQIAEIEAICNKAEANAKNIRANARSGFMTSLLTAGAAVAVSSPQNSALSDSYAEQAKAAFQQTTEQTNSARDLLFSQNQGIENKIDSKSFRNEESELDLGTEYVTDELLNSFYHYPDVVRNVITEFSKDKPALRASVEAFFNGKNDNNKEILLRSVLEAMSNIEADIIKYECRKLKIPAKVLAEF